MSSRPSAFLALVAVVGVLPPGVAAPPRWRLFESKTQHFSVRYPPSWNRLATWDGVMDENILDIINFPNSERVEGVVIKKGGAQIWAGGPPGPISSAADWIDHSLRGNALVSLRQVAIAAPSPGGCTRLERAVTRFKMDDAYVIDTAYYCTVGNRLYRVFLTNWEGDPHQGELQDVALKIALSLRSR